MHYTSSTTPADIADNLNVNPDYAASALVWQRQKNPAWKNSKSASAEYPGCKHKWSKWQLADGAAALLPVGSVSKCARYAIKASEGASNITVRRRDDRSCYYGGLQFCGSVWTCPVCASKIAATRGEELKRGIQNWRDGGGDVLAVTYTLSHRKEDSCADTLNDLLCARRRMKSGRKALKLVGVVGTTRGIETTVGRGNGWHVHCHELIFIDSKCSEENIYYVKSKISDSWLAALSSVGRSGSTDRAVDVSRVESNAEAYVSKTVWGGHSELTGAPEKVGKNGNLTVWQLIAGVLVSGDLQGYEAQMFREYAAAFKGCRQLAYSKGLRSLLGIAEDVKTDEEVANDKLDGGEELVTIDKLLEWPLVIANSLKGELLKVATLQGKCGLEAWLADLCWESSLAACDSSSIDAEKRRKSREYGQKRRAQRLRTEFRIVTHKRQWKEVAEKSLYETCPYEAGSKELVLC